MQYIAGCVILGSSPCSPLVLVWSTLVRGHAAYSLLQVTLNYLLMLILYPPLLVYLLSLSGVPMPYVTIVVAILVFITVPLLLGIIFRWLFMLRYSSAPEAGHIRLAVIEAAFRPVVLLSLLVVVLLTFMAQGLTVRYHWTHILLIAVPILLLSYTNFAIAYTTCYFFNIQWRLAAPSSFIAGSSFFELSLAVALALYGIGSGAMLAATVGVLTEIPIMLSLVAIAKATRGAFKRRDMKRKERQER